MLVFLASLAVAQTPTCQQVYDEMRAMLDKAQGVSFETSRINADAWEGEMGVFGRRPNIFSIRGLGLNLESDGKWLFETGNGGTYLRRLKPDDALKGYRGFEGIFEPGLKPEPKGSAQSTIVSWKPDAKAWRIILAYPKQESVELFVDTSTNLPLGWMAGNGRTYYYKNVKLIDSFTKPPRSVGPPTTKQLLSDVKQALSRYKEFRFSLKRDDKDTRESFRITRTGEYNYTALAMDNFRKIVKQFDQTSKKKVWEVRELFGFEEFIGRPSKLKYLSQPELRFDDTPTMDVAWMVNCSVSGSTKTIRLYFQHWNLAPIGYELVVKGQVVRKVAYVDLTGIVNDGSAIPLGSP